MAEILERIAAGRHQREHDDRREEHDDQCRQEPPPDERDHRKFLAERSRGTAASVVRAVYGV